MSLECSNVENDHLEWKTSSFAATAADEGDDTLHFSCEANFYYEGIDKMIEGSMALTDQGIYLTDEQGNEVLQRMECACVIDLIYYKENGCLVVESDEIEVLLQTIPSEKIETLLEVFAEEILPLPVTDGDGDDLATYAAEKKLPATVCSFIGLTQEDVEDHTVEDEVTRHERERKERLAAEEKKREEEERLAAEKEKAVKEKMAADKEATANAHRMGMRRLSMKRRVAEDVAREVKKWEMMGRDDEPDWWEGNWGADEDPYTMPESRVDAIASNLREIREAEKAERMKKILVILGHVENEETNQRRIVEGEYRIGLADVRETYDSDLTGLRRSERERKEVVFSLLEKFEKEEQPARLLLSTEEDNEWQRLMRRRASNVMRLDGVSKLLKSTRQDEKKMRYEIKKMEQRQWSELEGRLEKLHRKAARQKQSGEGKEKIDFAMSVDSIETKVSEEDIYTTLKQRTQSVRRRHLTAVVVSKRYSESAASPHSPYSAMSPHSPTSMMSSCYEDAGRCVISSLFIIYITRHKKKTKQCSALSGIESTDSTGSEMRSRTPTTSMTTSRLFPSSPFGSPTHTRMPRSSLSPHSPGSPASRAPGSPTVRVVSISPILGSPSIRRGVEEDDEEVGQAGECQEEEEELQPGQQPMSPEELPIAPIPTPAFAVRRMTQFEDWQNELRKNLGLSCNPDEPAFRAAYAAAVAVSVIQQVTHAVSVPEVRWESSTRGSILSVRPHYSNAIMYTYKPITSSGVSKGFSSRNSFCSHGPVRSQTAQQYQNLTQPSSPRAATASLPPYYQNGGNGGGTKRRSASPNRVSPLRGGGRLSGSLLCGSPKGSSWRTRG